MHTPSTKNKSNGTELSGAPRFPSAGRHAPDSSEGQPRREDAGIRPRRTGKPFPRKEGQSGHGSSRGGRSYPREGRRDFSGRGERRFSHDDRPSFHRDRSYDNSENGSERGSSRDERPSFSRDTAPRSDSSRGGYSGDSRPAPSSGDDGRSGYGQRKPFAKRWTVDEKDEQDFLRGNQFDGRDGYDVIILGAGASGLSCALRCTELGLSVCVIDRERTPARKLAICGGGRANFTNSSLSPDCYLCGTPGFVDPVLDAFSTMGMTRFMDSLGLPWEKREGGRYFLATSARDLVSALIRGCKKGRFALRTGLNVPADGVRVSDGSVTLTAKDGTSVKGRHLVLALGSPACPAVGATGFGYALAQALGHHARGGPDPLHPA